MGFPYTALVQSLLERMSFSESEPILASPEILIGKLTAILTEKKNFLLPCLPHRCHQGSKPCGKFGWFCVEWLPLLPDGVGTSWIHSCKTGGGKCQSIKARIFSLNLPF